VTSRSALVLDTMCLSHFALADRLDVLRDLLIDHPCRTTGLVLDELSRGAAYHPALSRATSLDWLAIDHLDQSLGDLLCFEAWTARLGAGARDLGEASVFASVQMRGGTAITDDRGATRVGRTYGLDVHGTVWLLAAACRSGKLTLVGASNLVESLRSSGMRLPCTGAESADFASRHGLLKLTADGRIVRTVLTPVRRPPRPRRISSRPVEPDEGHSGRAGEVSESRRPATEP
jgi:predicted nucleic acid-binding protein